LVPLIVTVVPPSEGPAVGLRPVTVGSSRPEAADEGSANEGPTTMSAITITTEA